jgi:hypothetical protein
MGGDGREAAAPGRLEALGFAPAAGPLKVGEGVTPHTFGLGDGAGHDLVALEVILEEGIQALGFHDLGFEFVELLEAEPRTDHLDEEQALFFGGRLVHTSELVPRAVEIELAGGVRSGFGFRWCLRGHIGLFPPSR